MGQYGFDGNMNAVNWLEMTGNQGVANLQEDDRAQLKEAGILDEKNQIRPEQLALAIQYFDTGHVICDAVGKKSSQKTEGLAAPQCQPHEKDFGTGSNHPFRQ